MALCTNAPHSEAGVGVGVGQCRWRYLPSRLALADSCVSTAGQWDPLVSSLRCGTEIVARGKVY